jgi:hypothetical protein
VSEQGKAADPVEAPSVDDAAPVETPAEPAPPSPEQQRIDKLEADLTALRAEQDKVRADARESGSRAQSTADKHAARLEKRIERLSATLEQVAALNMDEPSLRAWRAQQENERLRESITEQTSEVQTERQRAEFQTYSAQLLAEEGIASSDPVLTEAWNKYSAQAKDPSDWKAALSRAVADVRKAEAKVAIEKAKTAAEQAREDERNRIKNERRTTQGPTDQGVAASVSRKPYMDMTDEEFAADSAKKKAERDRKLMRIGR